MISYLTLLMAINMVVSLATDLEPPPGFDHSIYLDSAEKYRLFWEFDDETITFEVSNYNWFR